MAFRTETIGSWAQFRELADSRERKRWAFRGQAHADAPLYSSLSRYLMTHGVHPDAWPHQELRILRIFQRKGHQRIEQPPADDDLFQWLALMQHYGAPTRLLDFTWSPYVAAFFALEAASAPAVVWALCPPLLPAPDGMAPWIDGSYERDFLPNRHRVLVVGEPRRMNPRLSAQAGTFVTPGILDEPLEQLAPEDALVKLVLDAPRLRRQAMESLYSMNINYATLYPDLDGLARSLAYELEFHWGFDPLSGGPAAGGG